MQVDIYDAIAYVYDRTLEGLLTCIFTAYERHESPSDILKEGCFTPRLSQSTTYIATDIAKAKRVQSWIRSNLDQHAYRYVLKGSLSGDPDAPSAVYRFVAHAVSLQRKELCAACTSNRAYKAKTCANAPCPRLRRLTNNISHKDVEPLFKICRAVDNECEKIRQFARFEHLRSDDFDLWFSKINPKDSVVPLVMGHFVERFNIQPFVLFDEVHNIAGVYEGKQWFMTEADQATILKNATMLSSEEAMIQDAWKRFYKSVAINERYHPELQVSFMPKRFWKNITEMQETLPSLCIPTS